MNMKRKNYSAAAMSPSTRGNDRSVSLDGVYNNSYFMNSVTELIGNVIKVHTSSGPIYEGIFRTFSADFEIVLELAHKVDPSNPSYVAVDSIVDTIIFRAEDITLVEIIDADLEYATRNAFQTDTAVSKFNGQITEKELEPWDCSGNNIDDFELDRTASNGWDVNDMFRRNEQMYGVTSNFDHGLSAYTTPLPNKDSKYYKDAEAKAAKIASEIESNPVYKARIDMENGDEEEMYAAVVRPPEGAHSISEGGKYVCPPKRKNVQQGIKPFRAPQVMSNVPSPQSSAGNESPKVPPTVSVSQHDGPPTQSATSSGDRVNGTIESPRPQRPPINPRYARSFSSNEIIRHNGGSHIGVPIRSNSVNNSVMEIRNPPPSSTQNNNSSTYSSNIHSPAVYSSNGVSSSTESYHHRKPPPIHQSDYQTTLSVPRKSFKGRDAQTTELKKFGAEFKLNENAEDKKSNIDQPSTEPTNSHPSAGNEKSEQKSEVSSTARTSDLPDGKILNSTLNPNAKEFVYNPTAKPFTPRSVNTTASVTTGTTPQPRPPQSHQTQGYGGPAPPIQTMVMPTYVVTTSQPPYSQQQQQQTGRYRKVQMGGMSQPSQMQVASVTGQPLLAPAPMHAQFAVPYPPQAIPPQQYQQMVRMVAQQAGGMGPPVLTAINYPPDGSAPQMQYIQGPASIGPYHPYHVHSAQNNASSPQATSGASSGGGSGGSNGGDWTNGGHPHSYQASAATSYSQPPPGPGAGPPNPPPYSYPMLCPMLPAAPPPPHSTSHNPHHMMQGAPTSFIHHHPHQHSSTGSQQQGSHIQVILPPHNQ